MQKRIFQSLATIVGCLCLLQSSQAAVELDRIIAVINDDVVMKSELDEKVRTVKSQLNEQGTSLPPTSILEKQVLDRLILSKLQIQMAENTGIRVDDESLNRTISNIAAENKLSLAEFRKILESDGYSYEKFREDIRHEILTSRLRQRQVDNRITVTEREIKNFLDNKEHQGEIETEYSLAHILVSTPEGI
ncbi:MAG: molecular chaperone SurA, partial [Gammaproteobacteria bacterium]|nr:molecular chaperone SurA [Gammaproteobacteria bacterium]